MILALAMREFKSLFLSPMAWSILAVIQLILSYLFLGRVQLFLLYQSQLLASDSAPGLTQIIVSDLLGSAAIILLLVIPLLTMRLVSEERRNRTLNLLFSAPISMSEIVLGKYLGVLFFLILMVIMIALMPLSLLVGGKLDVGLFISSLIGLTLLLAGFAAVGLFMSTLTQYPAVAAISTFGTLLLFWILDWSGQGITGNGSLLAYLSLFNHYKPFLDGIFDSADAIYHLLFITTFLVLSIRRLDADRLGA